MQYIIYSVALLLYLLCLSSPQLPSPCSEDHYRLISKKILQSTDIPKPSTKYNSPFTPHHSLRHDIHDHHLIGTCISIYLVDSRAIHSRHSSPIQLFWASVVRCTWMVLIGCWVFAVVVNWSSTSSFVLWPVAVHVNQLCYLESSPVQVSIRTQFTSCLWYFFFISFHFILSYL